MSGGQALPHEAPALLAVPIPNATAISGFYPPEPLSSRPSPRRS
jgi:hypothetical protein